MATFRRGQWVKTTRDLKIKVQVAGQDLEVNIPAQSVGIHHGLDLETREPVFDLDGKPVLEEDGTQRQKVTPGRVYHSETGLPKSFMKGQSNGLVGLHIVDSESGFNTVLEAAVPPDALEPITDLEEIPEPRRKTMSEGWKPTA